MALTINVGIFNEPLELLKVFTFTVRTRNLSGNNVKSEQVKLCAGHSPYRFPPRPNETVTFYSLLGAVLKSYPSQDIVSITKG